VDLAGGLHPPWAYRRSWLCPLRFGSVRDCGTRSCGPAFIPFRSV
jgi:hypothetical protein